MVKLDTKSKKKPSKPIGRPTNEKRSTQGHINTYEFKFKEELKRLYEVLGSMEVEKFLKTKGFKRDFINIDFDSGDSTLDQLLIFKINTENRKRSGVLWFRYVHPEIPKFLNSEWNVAIALKSSLVESPAIVFSFVLYHPNLTYHLDLGSEFSVAVKALDRNKIGIENALVNLFDRYQELQKMLIVFNKATSLNAKSKAEAEKVMAKVRLTYPFSIEKSVDLNNADFSGIENAISKHTKFNRLLDYICYLNHYLLEGVVEIKYFANNGKPLVAGKISNVRRHMDLRNELSAAATEYIKSFSK